MLKKSKNTDTNLKDISIEKHLSNLLYELKKLYKIESSKIEIFNDQRFIIINYFDSHKGANVNIYDFFNDHEREQYVVHGIIRYDKATQQKDADKLLKTILSSLKTK